MGARINIYQLLPNNGVTTETVIYKTYLENEAVHEEEMSVSNFIRLSFNGTENIPLPAGSYIKIDGIKYRLFETYYPKINNNRSYKYTPEFHHPIMLLGRTPYFHLDGNTEGNNEEEVWGNATKETEWSFYGYAETLINDAITYIRNYLTFLNDTLATEISASSWECVVDEYGRKAIEISVSASDIFSVISQSAEQCGCEFHFDFSQKILYFGDVANLLTEDPFVLKSGYNVTHANVTNANNENYYNRYIVLGGTTNLSQPAYMGGNVKVTKRLTLPDGFTDSIIDLRGNVNVPADIKADANEPALTGQLVLDDVYPKLRMYIYDPRERQCYKLDENGNETTEIYSKWYIKLAYRTSTAEDGKTPISTETVDGTTYYWYQYIITDNMRIADVELQFSFIPNYDSETLTSPLAGRTFKIVTFDDNTQENAHNYQGATFDVEAGEYRIEFEEEDGLVIPSRRDQGLFPQGLSTPSTENNIVSIIGVVVTDELKTEARAELLNEAISYIQYQRKNRNTYTFDSYVKKFDKYRKDASFRLYVGQKVIYDDGGDLIGGTSIQLETKIRKLITHMTDPNNIKIEVGNERIVGRRESYEKKVETLITYVGSGGGNTISDATFLKLLTTYGRRLFLSKVDDDNAIGLIDFLQGAVFGPANSIWGYVRNTLRNGTTIAHAWFRNLFAENFETAIAKVTNYITGNNGRLLIQDDVTIQKANNADATLNVAEIESKNIDNTDTIKTHNLVVTGLAHFFELVIDKIRAAGGAMILSPAEGFVVAAIDNDIAAYPQDPNNYYGSTLRVTLLFYRAKDKNGKSVTQSWEVGDQALCRNFHSVEEMEVGQVTQNVSNKYYWSLVLAVSENTVNLTIEGETVACHWIMVYSDVIGEVPSGIDTNSHGVPIWNDRPLWDGDPTLAAVGDEIVMLGHRGNGANATERKAAVYMSAYSALDTDLHAPFLAFYQGIDDFDLKSHRKTYMDANGSKFFGEFFALSASGNGADLNTIVSQITSSNVLTGGDAKTQLRQRWDEMVAEYVKLNNKSREIQIFNVSDEYDEIYSDFENAFYYLHAFLDNNYTSQGHSTSIIPSWIADENLGTSVNFADADLISGWNAYATSEGGLPFATNTLATVHTALWSRLYNAMGDLERALNTYQMDIINNIGSDNILSAKEKAMLKQMFANEVAQYFELKGSLASFSGTIYKTVNGNQVAVTISDLTSALNTLGTYLNNDVSWSVGNDSAAWVYPTWINTDNNVNSTAITSSVFNTYWQAVFDARQTLSTDIANASQSKIDGITASVVVPNKYVTEIDPLTNPSVSANVKEGDFWYQPVTLNNPIGSGTLQGDYYNEYICQGSGNNKTWLLLNSAQAALLNVAHDIYMAVFDNTNSSSIVQTISSIDQSVKGMRIGGRNLILNSDFSERNGTVPKRYTTFNSASLALDTTDAPMLFADSLLVGVNEDGAGVVLPVGDNNQTNIRLESGAKYVLSFYIKLVEHTGTAPTIQVKRGSPVNILSVGESAIDTAWQRLSFIITGDGNNFPIYIVKPTQGSFRIAGLQLEKGNVPSDWRRAEEDWQGQIELTREAINLRVTRNGLAQAGIQINGEDESVTIIGKKTSIDGDLDLQGLTTENVKVFDWNVERPIVVNMGLFPDNGSEVNPVTVKSVQIKARNIALDTTRITAPPLVALPFYDSAIEGWASSTNITFTSETIGNNSQKTFILYDDNSVPESLRRIVAYKRNGTRLTITNEADPFVANWQGLQDWSDNNSRLQQYLQFLRGNAVVVCSDSRLIAESNYDGVGFDVDKQLIPNNTEVASKWNAGIFSCGGYQARFIAVLPGQTLQLRSQIMTIDQTQEVLVWVVENPTEFVPMLKPLSCESIGIYSGYAPTVNFARSHRGVGDCWMGHPVLSRITSTDPFDISLERTGTEE